MAIAVAVAGALALASAPAAAQTRLTKTDLEIRTLSTHPDTVSGGDVLVLIKMPGSLASDKVSVMLNGRDVNPAFRVAEEPNSLVGLVSGLQVGKNQLEVGANGKQSKLTLVNHPATGPVISGPQQTPFICETETLGLGPALASSCSVDQYSSLMFDSSGVANIFFYNQTTNAPMLATAHKGSWLLSSIARGGGTFLSAAAGPGDAKTFVYRDSATGTLLAGAV